MKEIEEFLLKFGEEQTKAMIAFLRSRNKVTTGTLLSSFRYDVRTMDDKSLLEIFYADYGTYVDQGRKPGSMPPVKPIEKWCRIKGIPESAAWGIATNIKKFGVKPVNFTKIWDRELQSLSGKVENEVANYVQLKLDDIAHKLTQPD